METSTIYKYLISKGLYTEVYHYMLNGLTYYCVSIEWGDWKHEHAYLDYLMQDLGFTLIDTKVTEDNGSDCYSGEHTYLYSAYDVAKYLVQKNAEKL